MAILDIDDDEYVLDNYLSTMNFSQVSLSICIKYKISIYDLHWSVLQTSKDQKKKNGNFMQTHHFWIVQTSFQETQKA